MGDRTSKAGQARARGDRPGIVCARIESRKQKPVARIARRLMDVPAARRLVAPSLSRPSSVARASLSIPLQRPAVVVSSSRSTSDGIFHLCTFCSAEVEPLADADVVYGDGWPGAGSDTRVAGCPILGRQAAGPRTHDDSAATVRRRAVCVWRRRRRLVDPAAAAP
jgi:hypothetical protein